MNKLNLLFVILFSTLICNSSSYSSSLTFWYQLIKTKTSYIIDSTGINSKCTKDLKALIHDAFQRKLWALKMLDANTKLSPGLLFGNIYQFGNYDECLSINEDRPDIGPIIGQYCSIFITPKTNSTLFFDIKTMVEFVGLPQYASHQIVNYIKAIFGVCIPASCSIENLQMIWDAIEVSLDLPFTASYKDALCDYKGKQIEPYGVDVFIYAFFAIVLAIVFISTVYDLFLSEEERQDNLLLVFSVLHNGKKLLTTHHSENATSLTCIYGLKVFSMMWVVLGHRVLANSLSANFNSLYIFQWKDNIQNSNFLAATLSVDTFFVISGTLLMYVYLSRVQNMRFTLLDFYMHRLLRLMPPLIATVLFYITILKNLGNGPFWQVLIKKFAGSCFYCWWSTLLFLTNQMSILGQCVEQTWYLAVDTQLYLLSPLILFNIDKHKTKIFIGIILATLLSIIYTLCITIAYDIPGSPTDLDYSYFTKVYMPTFTRMPAWLIGLIIGYFVHKYKTNKLIIPQPINLFLWSLTTALLLALIMCHVSIANTPTVAKASFFNAIARPLWSLSMGYVIFACSTGHGGFVNHFLSLPIFNVVGKLTYSMYLTHLIVLIVLVGRQRGSKNFGSLENYHEFFGDYVFVVMMATAWCLLFEMPITSFLNILNKRCEADKKSNNSKKPKKIAYNFWILSFTYKMQPNQTSTSKSD